jgi:hypothetical protein
MMGQICLMERHIMAYDSGLRISNGKQQYWKRQITLWRRSGLSKVAFCRENKISRWSFHYWKKKLQKESEEVVSFVKLPTISIDSTQSATFSVRLSDRYSVEIENNFSSEALKRLLDVLEERNQSC